MLENETVLRPTVGARICAYSIVCGPLSILSIAVLWQAMTGHNISTNDLGVVIGPSLLVAVIGTSILWHLLRRQTFRVRAGKLISFGLLLRSRSLRPDLIEVSNLVDWRSRPNANGVFLKLTETGTGRSVLVNTAIHDVAMWEQILDKHGVEFVR